MKSFLDQIGGEDVLHALVHAFYDLMESHPRGENLRHLHFNGRGFSAARTEQIDFLSGFFGGRQHYKEVHGHMNVKENHAHVPITTKDAEDWLFLMDEAMTNCEIDDDLRSRIMKTFNNVAFALVNNGTVPKSY